MHCRQCTGRQCTRLVRGFVLNAASRAPAGPMGPNANSYQLDCADQHLETFQSANPVQLQHATGQSDALYKCGHTVIARDAYMLLTYMYSPGFVIDVIRTCTFLRCKSIHVAYVTRRYVVLAIT